MLWPYLCRSEQKEKVKTVVKDAVTQKQSTSKEVKGSVADKARKIIVRLG